VNHQDPVRSVSQRLWSWVLSALGLVIALNILWALLRPWLPLLIVVAVAVGAFRFWRRHYW
jgi:hypothetical protein